MAHPGFHKFNMPGETAVEDLNPPINQCIEDDPDTGNRCDFKRDMREIAEDRIAIARMRQVERELPKPKAPKSGLPAPVFDGLLE